MALTSSYPVLLSDKVEETARFYIEKLGFEKSFSSDWYVSMKNTSGETSFELAVLQYDHETILEKFRKRGEGVLYNFEVTDVTAEYERLSKDPEVSIILKIRDEAFGQRHFIMVDPSGNMIDVIENIPPSEEFLAQYRE